MTNRKITCFLGSYAALAALLSISGEVVPALRSTSLYVQGKDAAQSDPLPGAKFTLELLTPTEGADFKPFMTHLYGSIKSKWIATMPEPVSQGAIRGLVVVRLKIQKDGTLPDSSLKIQISSRNDVLDEHAVKAVRTSAPFDHLPESFSSPDIELRVTFYYNLSPPPRPN
jgi:TonB family protein